MTGSDRPFRWEQLDQRLLRPRLEELSEEMQKRSIQATNKAAYDTRESGNTAGYFPRLFEAQRQLTDEWAQKLYDVHCEVWRIQGHSITADFIRAVSNKAIPELIATRKGTVESGAQLWCMRTRHRGTVPLRMWTQMTTKLRGQWARDLEAKAVASEYGHRETDESANKSAARQELFQGGGEGAMRYPPDFPPESRARVEAEKIRAGRDFDSAKQSAEWTRDVEALLRKYILRMLLTFAKEAQDRRLWPVDRMDKLCREFLRLATIDAYYEKGYDTSGRRLSTMSSHLNGAILSEVQREFEKTPEWKQYQDALLEVAQAQSATGAPQNSGAAVPMARSGHNQGKKNKDSPERPSVSPPLSQYRSGVKRGILMQLTLNPRATDHDICRGLDADGGIELPATWKTNREDRLFAKAYMDPRRRRKVEVTISKVRTDLRRRGLLDRR